MGMDPKHVRVLEEGDASEEDQPRDTSREAAREQIATGQARRALKARREHSKGDGNFPAPEPRARLDDENVEDRTPHDLPKADDDRSAPKGNTPVGQRERNPELEIRDDFRAEPTDMTSGFEEAQRAAAPSPKPARAARPTARRSSAAKRDAIKKLARPPRRATRAKAGAAARAPKAAKKNAKRAAATRRAQPGQKRAGTVRRGAAAARPRSGGGARRRRR